MTSPAAGASSAAALPDYAPVPRSSLGPALNDLGYYVGRVERNLYWVTDGTYQSAFLTTRDGVVLFDAPPSIGQNLRRAVDEVAAAEGVSNSVTTSSTRITTTTTARRHCSTATWCGSGTRKPVGCWLGTTTRPGRRGADLPGQLHTGRRGERVELAWHGPNHSPDNIYIHFPDHGALMLVDIVNPGWVPIYNLNLSEDVPGYIQAAATALSYPWTHFIGGHVGRLGDRDDIALHQRFIASIESGARQALATVDPTPYFQKYGQNVWAAVAGYLDAVTDHTVAPVIAKYTGVLAAADVAAFTASTAFTILQSIRLDLGPSSPIHP